MERIHYNNQEQSANRDETIDDKLLTRTPNELRSYRAELYDFLSGRHEFQLTDDEFSNQVRDDINEAKSTIRKIDKLLDQAGAQ